MTVINDEQYQDGKISHYAILSHTWLADGEEVNLKDITEGTAQNKAGSYQKIEFCRKQAANHGLKHFWVDTCCAELSEAIFCPCSTQVYTSSAPDVAIQ